MAIAHQFLYDEIVELPPEKLGKALSFVRFLKQEPELEPFLDPDEAAALQALYYSDDFSSSADVLDKIMRLPNDKVS